MSEHLLLCWLLLLTGSALAQPRVHVGDSLWRVAEVLEPDDSLWRAGGPAERAFRRGSPTFLRFRLPRRRGNILYVVFNEDVADVRLMAPGHRSLETGSNQWGRPEDRATYVSRQALPIPPDWTGLVILRLQQPNNNRWGKLTKPFVLQLLDEGTYPLYYKTQLDPLRERPYRRGVVIYLYALGALLSLVIVAWVATRQPILLAYLGYTGLAWAYYFLRKGYLLGIGWPTLPTELYSAIEVFGSVAIILAYLYFLRRFLDFTVVGGPKVYGKIERLGRMGIWAIGISVFTLLVSTVSWAYLLSTITSAVLVIFAFNLLYTIYRQQDPRARVVVWAATPLLLALTFTTVRWMIRLAGLELPDIEPMGMSPVQTAVLLESGIMLFGVMTQFIGQPSAVATAPPQAATTGDAQSDVPPQPVADPHQPPPRPDTIQSPGELIIHQVHLPVEGLIYLRSKRDHFFAAYLPDGVERQYPGRLTEWHNEQLPHHPQFARISRSMTVNLMYLVDYVERGNHPINMEGLDTPLRVTSTFRGSFAERLAARPPVLPDNFVG